MSGFSGKFAELYHYLAKSDDALPTMVRKIKREVSNPTIPIPPAVVRPALYGYLTARSALDFGKRIFVAQPFLQAYCKECGPGLRTGSEIHWIEGQGDLILGSNVWMDGRCTIIFGASFTGRPVLEIGDGSAIGNGTNFAIGKRIKIGKNCNISGETTIFDSNGHPSDPVARREHKPPPDDQVRPVTIGDDVWIGKSCLILPGVRIGDAAIIAAGSVVRTHVPPYCVVSGNPARIVYRLPKPGEQATQGSWG